MPAELVLATISFAQGSHATLPASDLAEKASRRVEDDSVFHSCVESALRIESTDTKTMPSLSTVVTSRTFPETWIGACCFSVPSEPRTKDWSLEDLFLVRYDLYRWGWINLPFDRNEDQS